MDRLLGSRRNTWLLVAACLVLLWVTSGVVLRALDSGKVLGGTSFDGVDLGGQTRVEAARAIEATPPRSTSMTDGQKSFTVRAPRAGLVLDTQATAQDAYSAGRSGIGSIIGGPLFLVTDREVEPVYEPLQERRLKRTIDRIADKVDREPFVGALTVDPDSLEVTTKRPEAGLVVRRPAAREQLVEAIESGNSSTELPMRRKPAPTEEEVQTVADQAEEYLYRPVRIRTAGGPASFGPEQISTVLAIESTENGIRLGVDEEALDSLVAGFAEERDRPARSAGIDTPATPPVTLTEQGDLTWTPKPGAATPTPARPGRRIKRTRAEENLAAAIRDGYHEVRFPTEVIEPGTTNAEAKGASALLGTFTTNFSCCEPRVTNIQRMAETVDGTVVGPGEQFSLNSVAGPRTRANGYKPAPTIGEGNELIDTVGGGVSQFSTTLYNAAYFAGLQIDSHTPHSFYIDRYPAGREATLNYGSIDQLWTNDTDSPVVIRSSADDTSVTVSIYGDNGGRKVRAKTVSRSANSSGGFDIKIERIITDPDGERRTDSFTTNYGLPAE